MAWYPLYCVPEAPLTARFLTFHTLASLWEAASEAAEAHRRQQAELAAAAAAEVQRQRASAKQRAEAGEEALTRHQPAAAAAAVGSGQRGLPSRPSYKSMLEARLAAPEAGLPPAQTATPTAVCSFPGSPTCSDAGTRTTLASSRPHSVDGASLGRSRLACRSGPPSSASSDSERGCEAGSHAASSGPASASYTPASPAASEVADNARPLPVPVAGLVWYATGRDENWQETLVATPLPSGWLALVSVGTLGFNSKGCVALAPNVAC